MHFIRKIIINLNHKPMKKLYYLGIYKRGKTIVLQATTNKDCLNCEIIEYFGTIDTTKKLLIEKVNLYKREFILELRRKYRTLEECTKLRIE
jgi:hypothetical protein